MDVIKTVEDAPFNIQADRSLGMQHALLQMVWLVSKSISNIHPASWLVNLFIEREPITRPLSGLSGVAHKFTNLQN